MATVHLRDSRRLCYWFSLLILKVALKRGCRCVCRFVERLRPCHTICFGEPHITSELDQNDGQILLDSASIWNRSKIGFACHPLFYEHHHSYRKIHPARIRGFISLVVGNSLVVVGFFDPSSVTVRISSRGVCDTIDFDYMISLWYFFHGHVLEKEGMIVQLMLNVWVARM